MRIFADRQDAGTQLADALAAYANRADVVVLALPRGGVPVGFEVATRLGLPMDVLVVRKLGTPGHEELAMGAIASGGAVVLDRNLMTRAGVSDSLLDQIIDRERAELERREWEFRGHRRPLEIEDKTVIVVDDGLATGATMLAAVKALRSRHPARLVIAVPVAPSETVRAFEPHIDQMVCLYTPRPFRAVGLWYDDFAQTTDAEVRELLDRVAHGQEPSRRAAAIRPSPDR